jgi:hypothetical protein
MRVFDFCITKFKEMEATIKHVMSNSITKETVKTPALSQFFQWSAAQEKNAIITSCLVSMI